MITKNAKLMLAVVGLGGGAALWLNHEIKPNAAALPPPVAIISSVVRASLPITTEAPASYPKFTDPKTPTVSVTPVPQPPAQATPTSLKIKVMTVGQMGLKPVRQRKKIIQDPDAREALSQVGVNPLEEKYWISAINNPGLPPNERRELIEDLNQDGFVDEDHPSPEEIPMIASRMELINKLLPTSMDQTNYDAFQEAYKDLEHMLASATNPK